MLYTLLNLDNTLQYFNHLIFSLFLTDRYVGILIYKVQIGYTGKSNGAEFNLISSVNIHFTTEFKILTNMVQQTNEVNSNWHKHILNAFLLI